MYHNEEVPDNLGGLSGMLPAEILKLVNELLEQQLKIVHTNNGSKIELVYVASGGQHVDTIQSQNIYTYKRQNANEKQTSVTPPPEAMAGAVEQTMAQGFWWASTAWAVVYRVYQMKGYTGGIRQFVREVEEWPWQKKPAYECNYDAVCKPIRSGRLAGTPDGWVRSGASSQYAILGQELLNEFQKVELQLQK